RWSRSGTATSGSGRRARFAVYVFARRRRARVTQVAIRAGGLPRAPRGRGATMRPSARPGRRRFGPLATDLRRLRSRQRLAGQPAPVTVALREEVRALTTHPEGAVSVLALQRGEQRLELRLRTSARAARGGQCLVEPAGPAPREHGPARRGQREVDALAVQLVRLPGDEALALEH